MTGVTPENNATYCAQTSPFQPFAFLTLILKESHNFSYWIFGTPSFTPWPYHMAPVIDHSQIIVREGVCRGRGMEKTGENHSLPPFSQFQFHPLISFPIFSIERNFSFYIDSHFTQYREIWRLFYFQTFVTAVYKEWLLQACVEVAENR